MLVIRQDNLQKLVDLESRMGEKLKSSVEDFRRNRWNRRIRSEWFLPSGGFSVIRLTFWTHGPRAKSNNLTIFGGDGGVKLKPSRPRSTILAVERRSIRRFAHSLQDAFGLSVVVSRDTEGDRLILDISPR